MHESIIGSGDELVFPWVRFWTPQNKSIQLGASGFWGGDSDGFLADPEERFLGSENRHLLATDRLLEARPGCFVLCGEPGMGKTRALEAAIKARPSSCEISLKFCDIPTWDYFLERTQRAKIWQGWREGTGLLVLTVDGVDEGLIKIDRFVGALAGMLRNEPVSRLQLVLACRSLEWPHGEGSRLLALWPSPPEPAQATTEIAAGIYELCPLRERDVRLAADTCLTAIAGEKAGTEFLRELRKHHLIALGSRPLTLKMLLSEFAKGAGRFPKTHRELYANCTRSLLQEHDEQRRIWLRNKNVPRLTVSEERRARVAGRIATLMLLCRRSAIARRSVLEPDATDLTFAEIMHGPERLGDTTFEVDETLLDAVLETPLFWPKTEGRADFYHRTFAEHLAGEYMSSLPFPQQRSLLFQRDAHGEHVHPQLGEVAAWLADKSESLLRHLLANDPEVLLRTDVSCIRTEQKAALVDAILAKARAEELFDGAGIDRFFHTLRHPGLADQLRQTLHDRSANHVARRMALKIAEACRLEEMQSDAIRLIRSPADASMHHIAAAALDELATPATVGRVAQLLCVPSLSRRERLHVLHALFKHHFWPLREAMPYVRHAISDDVMSGHIIAQHATSADAEALLRGCLVWPGCFDSLSRFQPLVHEAYRHAVARIQEPRVRLLLTRVWWRARQLYQEDSLVSGNRDKGDHTPKLPELLKADSQLRRRFVADLISVAKGTPENRRWRIGDLLQPEDFPELVERACVGSKRRRRIYAQLAAHRFWNAESALRSSLLIEGLERSAELREAFPQMRLWVLGAADSLEVARKHLEWQLEHAKWNERENERGKSKPEPEEVWRHDLKLLSSESPPTHWLTLADNLSYQGPMTRDADEKRHDLTTTPGWRFHDVETRERITSGARRMLLAVPGDSKSQFGHLAYKALFLLRDEIETVPTMAHAVRRHWLPTIFDEFSNLDAHHLEMMALAYRLDAERMRGFLRATILRSANQGAEHCFILREFAACWDANLSSFVCALSVREVRNPAVLREVIAHLAEHDPSAAIHLWRGLRARHQKRTEWAAFAAATSALAGSRLFSFWEELWPVLTQNAGLARWVFLSMDRMDERIFIKNAGDAPLRRIGEMYLYLLDLFPKREDPPTPTGRGYTPTRRMDLARMRDELPALLGSVGTSEAVEELERIARRVPAADAVWIRWRKRAALVALRRASWRPPAAADVLSLVEKSERRWIQDEDDLMALVLESLKRLQRNISASPNSWRDRFWTRTPKTKSTQKRSIKPVDEIAMSLTIAQWLQVYFDSNQGLSILRELQVQHNKRTDIEVSAVAIGANPQLQRAIQIVIEVKGHWHPKIKTAHRDQLVGDYLEGCGRTHGIYLVVWTKSANDPRRSLLKAATPDEAQIELDALVAHYDGQRGSESLRAVVLDARL
jgi:hypothetical protein